MGTAAMSSPRYCTDLYTLYIEFVKNQCCNTDTNILQDYCEDDMKGTFRILTESIPCGTTESICSTAIKLYLGVHNTIICI